MSTTQQPDTTGVELRSPAGRTPDQRTVHATGIAVAAWSVPVLVATTFAMVAIVPVTIIVVRSLRDPRLRALRWWAVGLAALYATPLVLWAIGPDRAPSLSKDMSPTSAVLISVAGAVVAVRYHLLARR